MNTNSERIDGQTFLFLAESQAKTGAVWDVVLIQAGLSKNKTFYSTDVLRAAAPLFEGTKACAYRFASPFSDRFDHIPQEAAAQKPEGFAANVVGFFKDVRFGTFRKPNGKEGEGLLARFHVLEGADWLRKNLKDAFEHGQPDLLGFSIDARGEMRSAVMDGQEIKLVQKIEAVNSVDVVSEPAAGGGVTRLVASNNTAEENKMSEEQIEQAEQKLAEKDNKIAELNRNLLEAKVDNAIAAADLPEKVQARVREVLLAKSEIADDEISKAIEAEKEYIDSFKEAEEEKPEKPETLAAPVVTGLGAAHSSNVDVKVGEEQRDRYGHAMAGFFEGHDVEGTERFYNLKHALAQMNPRIGYRSNEQMTALVMESIAKAFPNNVHERFDDHHARLNESWDATPKSALLREAVTTSDFSIIFGDTFNKRLQREFSAEPFNAWRKMTPIIENLPDATNDFKVVRIGELGVLPTVNEGAPYQNAADPTEVTENLKPAKKGFLFKFTWEAMLADRSGVLRRAPAMLGRSTAQTVDEAFWDEINDNPTINTTPSTTNALISTAHNNLVTGNPALSYAEVTNAMQLLREQTAQDTTRRLGLMPRFLLVSTEKHADGTEITDSAVKVSATEDATVRSFINKLGVETFSPVSLGRTTANKFRWYITADPRMAEGISVGFLGGRDRPDIFVQSPADTPTAGTAFTADELTFKVRLVFGVKVVDFRWIAGSLATT